MSRKTIPAAALLLAGFASLMPGQATAQSAWTGPRLVVTGGNINGCNIVVTEATHSGSLGLGNIFVTFLNRGSQVRRITTTVVLSGNNSRKSGSVSPSPLQPGVPNRTQAFPPGGSTLNNTTLTVTITSCVPA